MIADIANRKYEGNDNMERERKDVYGMDRLGEKVFVIFRYKRIFQNKHHQ